MAEKVTLKSLQDRVNGKLLINLDFDSLLIKIDNSVIVRLNRDNTEISCGVDQLYSLPSNASLKLLCNKIKGDQLSFYKDLFKYSLKKYLNNTEPDDDDFTRSAFFIISNSTFENNSIINEILDSICQNKSRIRTNPKSGNKIKVWIF